MKLPCPLPLTSSAKFQNGSVEISWEMDRESLRLETKSESYIFEWLIWIHCQVSWLHFNPFYTSRFNHWFDGMALLHQFKIAKGQVTYKSRFLASDSFQSNQENNRIAVSEFGTITMPDPCKNVFQRFLSRFELPSKFFIGHINIRIINQDVHMHTWH